MPIGLKGLWIAVLIAAVMSSLDSAINASCTIFSENIYKPFFASKPFSNQNELKRTQHFSVLYTIIAVGIACICYQFGSDIADFWLNFESIFGCSVLGLFLLSFIGHKGTKLSGFIGILSGLTVSGLLFIYPQLTGENFLDIHPLCSLFFGTLACVGSAIAVNKFFLAKPC